MEYQPVIEPDYRDVTIPFNIIPLNFTTNGEGDSFDIKISSGAGSLIFMRSSGKKVIFPIIIWEDLLSINKGRELIIEIASYLKDKSSRVYRSFKIFI